MITSTQILVSPFFPLVSSTTLMLIEEAAQNDNIWGICWTTEKLTQVFHFQIRDDILGMVCCSIDGCNMMIDLRLLFLTPTDWLLIFAGWTDFRFFVFHWQQIQDSSFDLVNHFGMFLFPILIGFNEVYSFT